MDEANVPCPMCIGSHAVMEEQDPRRDHTDLSMPGSSGTREEGHSIGHGSSYEDKRIKYLEA